MNEVLHTAQSVAGNDGRQGELVSGLFVTFLIVAAVFYLLVIAFLLWAILRRRREQSREGLLRGVLIGWTVTIGLVLGGLTLASWFTDRNLARAAEAPTLEIELIGHQWWWEVRYKGAQPSDEVRTANELHLPVGVRAHISLSSPDVIHSLWIPNLAGKQDLIPGRETDMSLLPLRQGRFRGQCAEFCGIQHANMALDVTVESPAAFEQWRRAQLQVPPAPTDAAARRGLTLVTSGACASCHNIAGTPASGQIAPDLSHIASKTSLAAGTLPMSRANLIAWIADPQRHKPGNNMPIVPLTPAQLEDVAAYLETLR
jgi:cytochrome c oxidase subunit 2